MISISDASLKDIPTIQSIADTTWWATYSSILSKEQLSYMLGFIYSTEMLTQVMKDGSQRFIILADERGYQGFASYGPRKEDPSIYKLHKLYVLPDNHGKGFGRLLIDEIKSRMKRDQINVLDLNVNRHNPAKTFYEKLGFKVIYEEDVPVGPYFMNDYVMRLVLQ
jgi:diamine N-acetyltransferase